MRSTGSSPERRCGGRPGTSCWLRPRWAPPTLPWSASSCSWVPEPSSGSPDDAALVPEPPHRSRSARPPIMKIAHPHSRRTRAAGAVVVLGILLLILVGSFFRAQVVRGTAWALQSDSNRLRVLPVPAPRGTLFDRYGRIIADNVPSYSVSLFPAAVDSVAVSLERLQPVLGLSEERVESLMETFRRNRRQPLLVKMNLSTEELARLEELRSEFAGVFLEMRPRRRYIGGEALGHVMGYLGEVSGAELESPRFAGYEQGMIVGKDGLERQYEGRLQGRAGVRFAEVDAVGRIVGSFQGQAARPARPGDDLHLNLDLELQRYIHEIFPAGMRGAVVALNVEDGGVLALYSAPSFDPGEFVGGIDRAKWQALNEDPALPLYNRAVIGRYPPASTWKLASAAIALEQGVITPGEFMPEPCHGSYRFQGVTRRCWNPQGHGHLNLAGAIAASCNVYFYQMGIRVGLERMVEEGSRIGFNQPCGVDLPQETAGDFPDGLDWWQRVYRYRPAENEVMSIVIGQGPNAQTPLKMAQFFLALGRGGSAPAPRLFQETGEGAPEVEVAWELDLAPESVDALQEGLRQVMSAGTAFRSQVEHWEVIGKTGTAQHSGNPDRPHAWFAGLAGSWGGEMEIAIVVIVEEGMSGSSMAAPIAAKAADFHLRQKHGVPLSEIQTVAEHQAAGIPTPWAWNRMAAEPRPGPDDPEPSQSGEPGAEPGAEPAAEPGTGVPPRR
ncbi:MAG: penicillin-binding protein 2 [Gemmatimonadales bacterium]|nr:MAG: penicillin-binding protein 2 [Gemmatimonadales bacterium]